MWLVSVAVLGNVVVLVMVVGVRVASFLCFCGC